MESHPLAIAGVGLVTPLGRSAWETMSSLLAGRTLADRAAGLPAEIDPVSLVRALGGAAIGQLSDQDPTVELADRAAHEALHEAGVSPAERAAMPLVIGTSKGAIQAVMVACAQAMVPDDPVAAARVVTGFRVPHLPAEAAREAIALGAHHYLTQQLVRRLGVRQADHVVAACASGLVALHRAREMMLAPGGPERVLVVSVDAGLLAGLIHGYRRLGVLAPLTRDAYRAAPMHPDRRGFMLASMAAVVVLERRPIGPREVALLRTGMLAEAGDVVQPAPHLPAMGEIARQLAAGLEFAAVHPHAPGTPRGGEATGVDEQELALLRKHTGVGPQQFYAAKGALGHGLGASGLTSLVLASLIARTQKRPPMPWLDEPLLPMGPGAHLITAAGFGGHTAVAVIRR